MSVRLAIVLLVGLGLRAAFASPAVSLLDPIPGACSRRSSDFPLPDLLRIQLECADEASASGRPHFAYREYEAIQERCDELEANHLQAIPEEKRARVAAICTLALAEAVERGIPWNHFRLARRLRDLRTIAFNGKWDRAEQLFYDGRIRSALPPAAGQDLKTALISFHFLQRLLANEPVRAARTAYWMARAYERQGNPEAAEKFSQEALNSGTPDSFELARSKQSAREVTDAPAFGLTPFFFYNPARGYGAGLRWFDDRVFDRRRAAALDLRYATRAGPFVRAEFSEADLYEGIGADVFLGFQDGEQDFFGFGAATATDVPVPVRRLDGQARLLASLGGNSRFALGWRYASATSDSASALSFGTQMGPTAELWYDSRDSQREPRRGNLVSLRGFFPTEGLGSGRTFEEWALRVEHHAALGLRHTLSVSFGGTHVRGAAPSSAFPRSGWPWRFTGVRENRYTDRNLAGASVEYRWHVWPVTSLAVFATAVAASSEASTLLSDPIAAGAGVGWLGHFKRARSLTPRFELSLIGGEVCFQWAVLASW